MWPFGDTHFEINGVAINVDFSGFDVREHVAMVVIEVGNRIIIRADALGKELLIVDISFLHAKHCIELFGGINGISYPSDIAQVVALTFFYLYIDINMLVIGCPNAIF